MKCGWGSQGMVAATRLGRHFFSACLETLLGRCPPAARSIGLSHAFVLSTDKLRTSAIILFSNFNQFPSSWVISLLQLNLIPYREHNATSSRMESCMVRCPHAILGLFLLARYRLETYKTFTACAENLK